MTVSMRSKEFAHDYRYFPEPDLPPLDVQPAWVEEIRRGACPSCRTRAATRFRPAYGLSAYEADLLTQGRGAGRLLRGGHARGRQAQGVANWVLNELLRELPGDDDRAVAACPIPPANLAGLLALIDDGTISGKIAKDVFEKMYRSGDTAQAIVSREGLTQVADEGALGAAVDRVLAEHAKVVEDFRRRQEGGARLPGRAGDEGHAGQGQSRPLVNRLLIEKLPKGLNS